jgi:G2/mitotic-specific cyclin-B, other
MLENKLSQENSLKVEKPGQGISRAPLQNLTHENLPQPMTPSLLNPQVVKCYSQEIFTFLASNEENCQANSEYFSLHTEITHISRAFLVDWLVTIHGKFKLLQETLYIAVNLVDRYLAKRMVNKKQLQLVGVTAIFIASKYEEIYPPNAKDFIMATDQAYTKQHLIKMEVDMLKVIDFQITFPTPWRFMEKYPELFNNGSGLLAEYLLELGLIEYIILKYKPSIQAAAVSFLANVISNKNYVWKIEKPSESDIKECVKDFYQIFKASCVHPLTTVREKYIKKKLDIVKLESEAQ